MAEDRKVRIKIDTVGDTKGSDAAAKSLDRVADAARSVDSAINPMTDGSQFRDTTKSAEEATEAIEKQAEAVEEVADATKEQIAEVERLKQANEDVAEAKRKQADRELEQIKRNADEQAGAIRAERMSIAGRALLIGGVISAWQQGTNAIREQIAALREVSPAAAEEFAVVEAGLEALQNPIRSALLPSIRETEEAVEDLRRAIANAAQAEATYQQARLAREAALKAATLNRVETTLKRELQIIEDQNQALLRQQRILDAAKGLQLAQASLNDSRALANGADPALVRADAEARQTQVKTADVANRIAEAERNFNNAASAAQSAIDALAGIANDGGQQAEAARLRVEEAERLRNDAKLELETVRAEAELQRQAILTESIESIQGIAPEVGAAVTQTAEEAIALLQEKAAENGGKLTTAGQILLDKLTEIARDQIPNEQQAKDIASIIDQIRTSNEVRDTMLFSKFTQLLDQAETQARRWQQLDARIKGLENAISNPRPTSAAPTPIR